MKNKIGFGLNPLKEDIRDLITMVNPQNVIPSHGPVQMLKPMEELAAELCYSKKQYHLLSNSHKIEI